MDLLSDGRSSQFKDSSCILIEQSSTDRSFVRLLYSTWSLTFKFFSDPWLRCASTQSCWEPWTKPHRARPGPTQTWAIQDREKGWEGFQFGWFNIKRLDSAFPISITLCSNHLKWNSLKWLLVGFKNGSGPVRWSVSGPSCGNYWYKDLQGRIQPIRRQW